MTLFIKIEAFLCFILFFLRMHKRAPRQPQTTGQFGIGVQMRVHGTGNPPGRIVVQWIVNGVNAHYFDEQFDIYHSQSWDDVYSHSALWIRNPVALRGPTEIKCSVMGVHKTWNMNSKILLLIIKC